jgi:RNA recognition motif-containing protein
VKIYVGNLSRDVTEGELRQEFEAFGKVDSVTIMKGRYSGQPRGFGFVEMPTKAEGQAAIAGLKVRTCVHHWIIDTLAMKGVYYARCKKCGAEKDFPCQQPWSVFSVKSTNPTPLSPTELPKRHRGRPRKVEG